MCCAAADGQSGRAALAACAARRWLARNAAGVKLVRTPTGMEASAWTSLVSCLPALQDITLKLTRPLMTDDLGCLLEALAQCTRVKAMDLSTGQDRITSVADLDLFWWPFPDAAAFAKLRGLTKLTLSFDIEDEFWLADIKRALVPLTGLAELSICSYAQCYDQPAVAPAALGQLKGLRSLKLRDFSPCVLEAGCLDLPNLMSLEFEGCHFEEEAQVLPDVTALQCLTRFELSGFQGTCFLTLNLYSFPSSSV